MQVRVAELDDIFKGVGVKGKYPIPVLLRLGSLLLFYFQFYFILIN